MTANYNEEHSSHNKRICPVTGMEFMVIPGGSYRMGDVWGDLHEEARPVHEVTVLTFCLGIYTVTQNQWEAVMDGENPAFDSELMRLFHFHRRLNQGKSIIDARFEGLSTPVTIHSKEEALEFLKNHCERFCTPEKQVLNVKWSDAKKFIERLNQMTDYKFGYRLPSEAEWEYAARSGGKDEKWAGTSDISNLWMYADIDKPFIGAPLEVGQKCPNALGLYDMSGNMSEWCEDRWHQSYVGAPTDGSAWLSEVGNEEYVHRGGSWQNLENSCRTAYRGHALDSQCEIGFRVARDL
jgi:formylglycine-generating enzyme required for sulfatase activity